MDPAEIITIVGLAIAIYAIIPIEAKIDLTLRISSLDKVIIIICFLIIHYIIYFPVMQNLGLSTNLGPWKWGFNEKNTTYLIFIILGIYLYFRMKKAKVTRENIKVFSNFFEQLLLVKKHEELSLLIDRHFKSIINVKNSLSSRNKIAKAISTTNPMDIVVLGKEDKDGFLKKKFPEVFNAIANKIKHADEKPEYAINILRRTLNNEDFVYTLSSIKPYVGINILRQKDTYFRDDFLKLYFKGLIDNKGSIYYYELEQTQNLVNHHRYYLHPNNYLLFYLFKDVTISKELAVYAPVGEKICELLDNDRTLIERYNKPLNIYCESERFRCPIDSSLRFFEIMVIESMHQGIDWHMWLYYFPTFTNKILEQMNTESAVDLSDEWPTPFYYLLYHTVSILRDWLDEYQYVENKEAICLENDQLCHENGSIPKSAALVLGSIVFSIVSSAKISSRFKSYIVDIILRFLRDHKNNPEMRMVNSVVMKGVLRNGFYNRTNKNYLEEFKKIYNNVDHIIRSDLGDFENLIDEELVRLGH